MRIVYYFIRRFFSNDYLEVGLGVLGTGVPNSNKTLGSLIAASTSNCNAKNPRIYGRVTSNQEIFPQLDIHKKYRTNVHRIINRI